MTLCRGPSVPPGGPRWLGSRLAAATVMKHAQRVLRPYRSDPRQGPPDVGGDGEVSIVVRLPGLRIRLRTHLDGL